MNARVRNFRAKFCAKFRENRTFRIRTLYRLREIRTLWHTAQDTLVPGPGHYGARHSQRVSGAVPGRALTHFIPYLPTRRAQLSSTGEVV